MQRLHFAAAARRLNTLAGAVTNLATVTVIAVLVAVPAHAQKYPERPVRLISAYPPAGGVDITARIVGVELAKRLGQAVIIENRAGAAGTLGTAVVARAAADGYTILITANPSITILPQFSNVGYDPKKDLIPIAKVGIAPTILAVNTDSPLRNMKDFLEAGRQTPSRVSVGVPGAGSTPQIELTLLGDLVKSEITIVPYRGATFIVSDVLGSQITGGAMALPAIVPQIAGGKMRGLAVFAPARSSVLPDVPTVREATGVALDVFPTWYGFFAPAGTPREAIARLEADILAVMKEPSVIAKLRDAGTDALTVGSVAFSRENEVESAKLKAAVEKTKIQVQ
jgi:tripartite-type tricarboxylate transporter receptor subunit TctC